MSKLQKVGIVPVRETVLSALRDAIITRELKSGDVIRLNATAEKLGVSNTPVREALQRLEQEGLVSLRPNKGAVVTGITREYMHDYYNMRAILEREVAVNVSQMEDITPVVYAYQEADLIMRQGRYDEYHAYNRRFHKAIWTLNGNTRLVDLLASFWISTSQPWDMSKEENARISHSEHQEILAAMQAHDGERTRTLMNEHILRSMRDILTRFNA